jgi:DDE domain
MQTPSNPKPAAIVTDRHQPYVRATQQNLLSSLHIRTDLHRPRGETTKPIERSHIATRDRLGASRGLKTTATGQRFLDGFEAMHALRPTGFSPSARRQIGPRGDIRPLAELQVEPVLSVHAADAGSKHGRVSWVRLVSQCVLPPISLVNAGWGVGSVQTARNAYLIPDSRAR